MQDFEYKQARTNAGRRGRAARAELKELEAALNAAAADCDTEKIVELSGKKEDTENKLKYLTDAKRRVESLPVFPDGAINEEWESLCNDLLPDWKRRVTAVETAAAAYKEACSALLSLHDTVKAARGEFERTAAKEGTPVVFPPTFTADINTANMTIDKTCSARIAGITATLTGRPL